MASFAPSSNLIRAIEKERELLAQMILSNHKINDFVGGKNATFHNDNGVGDDNETKFRISSNNRTTTFATSSNFSSMERTKLNDKKKSSLFPIFFDTKI
jgi:hypothetical protein